MLVLSRRPGQGLHIGPGIELQVLRLEGDRVVLGIAAPRSVTIVRSELVDEVSSEVKEAADTRARLHVMLQPVHAVATDVPPDPGIA